MTWEKKSKSKPGRSMAMSFRSILKLQTIMSLAGGCWRGLCFICHDKSQLTGPEGKLTLPRQLWPLHNAWRSHAFWNGDGPQPKRWLSLTTTLLFLSFLPALFFCVCRRVFPWINLFVLTRRLSCMCTLMDPSECRPFLTLPGNSEHLVRHHYYSLLFVD